LLNYKIAKAHVQCSAAAGIVAVTAVLDNVTLATVIAGYMGIITDHDNENHLFL
jgi:hypothetical protein